MPEDEPTAISAAVPQEPTTWTTTSTLRRPARNGNGISRCRGTRSGGATLARDLGILYEPDVAVSAYRTLLLNDMFRRAESLSSDPVLGWVNCDVMLPEAVSMIVPRDLLKVFVIVGRRIDLDVD